MDKLGRVIYKGIVACVVAVGIANVVDYFYAALHASAATSGSANFKPSVVINPTATITLSNSNASLAVTPNKSGMFAYTQTPIRVDARTNTPNDVAVNMVPSGSANTLVSGSNSIATLDTTNCATGCATTSNYFLNRWGYNVTSSVSAPSTYLPVLTTTNQVLAYNNTAANISNSTATTRYVYFGMKVDQSTAPGTYSRALNFTVTVAPDPEPNPTMQDVDSSELAALMPNIGDSTTLDDERDGKSYTVAKLADGKYWMTTNLNLAGGTALSPADTDVTSTYIEGFTGGNGLTKSGNTIVLPYSSNYFSSDYNLAVVYNSGRTTCSSDSTTGSCYSYYSFPAATLGAKDSSGSTAVTGNGYNTAASICPKGWRLPTATTSNAQATTNNNWKTGDFYALATAYGANLESDYYENADTFYNNAGPGTTPNFLLSGYYSGATFVIDNLHGRYWSSSSVSDTTAYHMFFNLPLVESVSYVNRGRGLAVRCVFDQPTMQSVTSSKLATLMPNTGDTTTLEDERDGNTYTIAKLADGYYWMTQNLRLGKGDGTAINLSSSDSDLPSGVTFALKASGMGSNSPSSANGGDCNVGEWFPEKNATYFNVSHLCINTTDTNKYGVYYNWYTATAGTGKYETSSGNATGSICPKGWILPPNEGERSYYNLLFTKAGLSSNAASSTTMQGAPYNFPLSGFAYGTGLRYVGEYGNFWSSSAYGNTAAYLLDLGSSSIYPQRMYYKGYGYSVRCVFGS